ncbi:hypothetical protein [Actinomadura sp. 7K507]|uniref:hypothetical protein n=1 Tax=Actinomadura sp. 7K507 TaxID=2530365 RepID=UPI00140470BB|nr:hypothetical protein [Actinomadura sp. 7K507]
MRTEMHSSGASCRSASMSACTRRLTVRAEKPSRKIATSALAQSAWVLAGAGCRPK